MKTLSILLAGVFLLTSCAGMSVMPETNVGKANLYDATFLALVEQYNSEVEIYALYPTYSNILKNRRTALIAAAPAIQVLSSAAYQGDTVTVGMLNAVNVGLNQVRRYLLTRQRETASYLEIVELLEKAHVKMTITRDSRNPWLVLIELIQGLLVMYNQLQHQSMLNEAQLQAEFEANHAAVMTFLESDLIQVVGSSSNSSSRYFMYQ